MKIRLLLVFLFVNSIAFGQQTGAVFGSVSSEGKPLEFITVLIVGTTQGTTTDSEGKYRIENIPTGKIILQFSGIGFISSKQSVTITGDTQLNIGMVEDISQLSEVVVTGSLKEVSKMESSIPVEVYSPTLFRKNPTPNIFEGLSMINGVQPQINCNVCGTGDIRINGLDGPYTMVLLDGMPIVSSLSTVYGLSGIPNSLVKRIEVVKGPASTLFGSEAVGGLINIITQDATNAQRFQVDVFGTSVGEVNADVAGVFKVGKASSMVGVNHFRFENARDINNDNFIDMVLQNKVSVFNKWNFATRSGKKSSVAGRIYYEVRWGGELQWSDAFRGSNAIYGESIKTKRYEIIGSHPLSANEKLTLDYSYNDHNQDSYYGSVSYQAKQKTAFAQLRWNKQLGKHDLLVGLPYRFIFYDDNTLGTAKGNDNSPGITSLPGVFIQDELKFNEKLTLLTGLRYDHHTIQGSIVTPRFSVKYTSNKNNVIRLTGGRGFRVVNLFTEDHAALTGSREVIILNQLKPENSWNGNFNYVHTVPFTSGFINFDGSLFYTYFTNRIIGDFMTDPDKIIYDNLSGYAVSKGVSLNVESYFNNGLAIIIGGTLMDVYQVQGVTLGERIPQVLAPRFSGTGSVSYTLPNSKWLIDLTVRVNGPMFMPVMRNDFRSEKSPWVPLLNLQVTRHMHIKNSHWEIYGGVKNLLNFVPVNPILHPDDPFDRLGGKYFDTNGNTRPDTNPNGYTFDTAYSYAPMQGARAFFGIRFKIQ
jgi:outer membrane receptor for ferrienterochelin and colicins